MVDVSTKGDTTFRDIASCRRITAINNEASDADIASAAGTGSNGAVTGRYLTQLFLGTDSGSGEHALAQVRAGHDGTGTDENGYFSIHTNSGAEGTPNIAAGETLTERLSINAVGLVRVFGDLQVDGDLDVAGGIQFTDNQLTIHTVSDTVLRDVGFIARRSGNTTSGAPSGTADATATATLAASTTVVLTAGGSATDDAYNGWYITDGTDVAIITDYVGGTTTATLESAWTGATGAGVSVSLYAKSHVGTFYDESTDRLKFAYLANVTTDEFAYQGNVDVEAKNLDLEGTLRVDDTTDSTAPSNGSARFLGGVGIAKALFLGDGDDSTSASTGELVVNGGAATSGNIYAGGNLRVLDATESDSTTTGSGVFTGGVGVGGNLNVGGNLVVEGDLTYVSTSEILIEDKLIDLGVGFNGQTVGSETDANADGGGISLQGTTDKTITYSDSTNGAIFQAWSFSESLQIPSARALYFGDAETDGSWRMRDNGGTFSIDKRESGTYVNKWELTA